MRTASKPWWQQATALVSLSASGAVTGFSFAPQTPAGEPSAAHIRLLALQQAAKPARDGDAALRSAIVSVATYYLHLAAGDTPAEMEALIWQHDSVDGVDHGASCAAFASLTLELAAQAVGRQSWVTGGTSYPWPLHKWADARVDPNPASPDVVSVIQDAQAHDRWHPLGDGYRPQPGDWVLFDGHVEVVTSLAGGALHTIGGDSLPNFSVNAHEYTGSLAANGVAGFVNNGAVRDAASPPHAHRAGHSPAARQAASGGPSVASIPGATVFGSDSSGGWAGPAGSAGVPSGSAEVPAVPAIPAIPAAAPGHGHGRAGAPVRTRRAQPHRHEPGGGRAGEYTGPRPGARADVPGAVSFGPAAAFQHVAAGTAAIPGAPADQPPAPGLPGQQPAGGDTAPGLTSAQRAFIAEVVPGAIAAQREYGVPASVTIAQAIDESGWGQSILATRDNNLFGIKGTGPAGSDTQLTQEYEGGQWVVRTAPFRAYHNVAESISDHGRLLATSGYYQQAMEQRDDPDAFADALTGVYATDPQYGQTLIGLMRQYNLYRYDDGAPVPAARTSPGAPSGHGADPHGRRTRPAARQAAPAAPAHTAPAAPQAPAAPAPATPGAASIPGLAQPAPSRPQRTTPSSPPLRPRPSPRLTSPRLTAPHAASRPAASSPTAVTPPAVAPATPAPSAVAPAKRPAAGRSQPSSASPGRAAPPTLSRPGKQKRPGDAKPAASAGPATATLLADVVAAPAAGQPRAASSSQPGAHGGTYQHALPRAIRNSFAALAKTPIQRAEPLYRDVASHTGLRWELLAACDWMQCEARPRLSPVHGEKLGTRNSDGTTYWTKSAALEQCAEDLVELAHEVYRIDVTSPDPLSVRDLANAFAAFRWGALLKLHRTSAMEFPYSVAGLTVQHVNMRWPAINEPNAPDKPGGRFRMPFGAVPVVLSLGYAATA